jgi:hypothetical protein
MSSPHVTFTSQRSRARCLISSEIERQELERNESVNFIDESWMYIYMDGRLRRTDVVATSVR